MLTDCTELIQCSCSQCVLTWVTLRLWIQSTATKKEWRALHAIHCKLGEKVYVSELKCVCSGSIITWPAWANLSFKLHLLTCGKHILSVGSRSHTFCNWVRCCLLWPSNRDAAISLKDKEYSRHLHSRASSVKLAAERLGLSYLMLCVWYYQQWNSYPGEFVKLWAVTSSLSLGIRGS